ncbi:SRPBCC domain-containing protein [Agrococcus sp. Marseille-Q4369]|uniref:SRPBCC domain-containing protein n=1 Tax=Agrococcus sp. Marseille-Q4369 TaxID=2810513 RepID=UPI001B8D5360|nr:SRPBCC domain-containing protein [Agrococcus sp. Marseille-Q4369]QUW19759.1 SRPBCC domain-containing protein [Agrococcus sp. Marseille-Q4369]
MAETTHERVGEQSVVHRREFDASPEQVQRAHTTAELFAQWMGPRGSRLRIDRFEPHTGGRFDYTVETGEGEAGGEWRFWGSYHEVVAGRIVHTWEFQQEPGRPTLEVLEFRELPGGRSALEITSTYASKAACDAMVASGIDGGMDEDFERLDEALALLAR